MNRVISVSTSSSDHARNILHAALEGVRGDSIEAVLKELEYADWARIKVLHNGKYIGEANINNLA